MAVTKRTRYEVLRRDGHSCRYCGATAADSPLTVDHVIPVALGGSDAPDNLVAACQPCNSGKAATSPDTDLVEDVAEDATRWAAAMAQAANVLRQESASYEDFERAFYLGWAESRWIPNGIESTLRALFNAGLPADQVQEAADIASNARGVDSRRAYFAGVAWKRVRRMQEIAQQIIDSEANDGP